MNYEDVSGVKERAFSGISDAFDASDASDVSDVSDAFDAFDASDAPDISDAIPDVPDAIDESKGLLKTVVGKSERSRQRLKMIAKYIDIFEVIFIAKYIDYKLIAPLCGVCQRTIGRAFKEIRNDKYLKDLILEVKYGNSITVFATNPLFTLFGSTTRCPISKKKNKSYHLSRRKRSDAVLRVLKYKFRNHNVHEEISSALREGDLCVLKNYVTHYPDKQSSEFLVRTSTYQNYFVYNYEYDLIKFNNEVSFGSIEFCHESSKVVADLFCFSNDVVNIIRTYDKALLLLEALRELNLNGCGEYDISINYNVITLERVNIKEYIYMLNRTFRYHYLNIFNWSYDLNLESIRKSKWFFKVYKKTVVGDTNFILFSMEKGEFISYGKRH